MFLLPDVPSNRKMLKMLLTKIDADADMAENGQIAVNMATQSIDFYKVIFMDNLMPIMVSLLINRLINQ